MQESMYHPLGEGPYVREAAGQRAEEAKGLSVVCSSIVFFCGVVSLGRNVDGYPTDWLWLGPAALPFVYRKRGFLCRCRAGV